jgi:hypothetical protein
MTESTKSRELRTLGLGKQCIIHFLEKLTCYPCRSVALASRRPPIDFSQSGGAVPLLPLLRGLLRASTKINHTKDVFGSGMMIHGTEWFHSNVTKWSRTRVRFGEKRGTEWFRAHVRFGEKRGTEWQDIGSAHLFHAYGEHSSPM